MFSDYSDPFPHAHLLPKELPVEDDGNNKTFLNGPIRPLFRLFSVFFKQTIQFLQQINVKMSCPSSIWRQDSNPQPLEHETSPITTRPGLVLKNHWHHEGSGPSLKG